MNPLDFSRDVQSWRSRVLELLGEEPTGGLVPEGVAPEVYQKLLTALEELQVAEEELRVQNEALADARDALEAERERYQRLFEFAPDGYLVTDADGTIREANRAAAQLLNVSPEFLVGKPLVTFIPEDERRRFRSRLLHLAEAGGRHEWEARLRPRRGEPFDAILTVEAGRDHDGPVVSVRWLLRDATEYKRAEAERLRLAGEQAARAEAEVAQRRSAFLAEASAILAGSLDLETTLANLARLAVGFLADHCVIDLLEDGGSLRRVVVAHKDPAKEALLRRLQRGYLPARAEGHPVMQVLRTGEPVLLPAIPDSLIETVASDAEHVRLLRALEVQCSMIVPLVARGRTLGVLSLGRSRRGDGDDRRYDHGDVVLAQEFAGRAALAVDNSRLYRESQEALQARDRFLSIASHELRTPLTTLKGYAELVLRRARREGVVTERDQRGLQTVFEQANQLHRLLELLMDLSQIQAGLHSNERRPVDLSAVARRVVTTLRPTLDEHALELDAPGEPLVVEGDELRLEQVLQNLLQNAIKYSPQGGTVTVRLERHNGQAALGVSDQGIGIAPEQLERIFDLFYRGGLNASQSAPGTGLGLYVVKEIVSLHGGTVEVTSQEGEGSTFTVRLPLSGA